jgi:chloramphenicol 3-O-phosphotransferase
MQHSPVLILITGVMAAGKSSIAQALAEQLPCSVHLRGDLFRRMIVNGQAEMNLTLSDEGVAQLRLRHELAATVAKGYLAAGFSVVYQDIIIGDDLARVMALYEGDPLHVVVLAPSPDTLAARDAARPKTGYSPDFTPHAFDHAFRAETPRVGLWLDTSTLTVAQTVEHILAHLPAAKI